MQEEASGVENQADETDVMVDENQARTEQAQVDSEVVESTESTKPKKKSNSKKKTRIPTVEDIVATESENQDGDDLTDDVEKTNSADHMDSEKKDESQAESVENSDVHEESVAEESLYEAEDEGESQIAEQEKLTSLRNGLNLDSETALLETVLFLESEPQPPETLAKITQLDLDTINQCIDLLKEKYSNADSGIELSLIVGGWILTPKKESFDLVKERYGKKNEGRLSKAAIETLSIIAYSQPITRAEIESIRHVNADNMMKILFERKFIKEVGKKDIPGKPIMYGTTKEFLEFFHLQSIAELPQLDEKESERFELAR